MKPNQGCAVKNCRILLLKLGVSSILGGRSNVPPYIIRLPS
jgi:hypothetical protein